MAVEAIERPPQEWTAEKWFALPLEEQRFEIFEGEAVVPPMPNTGHSRAQTRLIDILEGHVTDNALGKLFSNLTMVFAEKNLAVPDLFFVANDRLHLLDDKCLRGAPTLAIEILSPSNRGHDRVRKYRQYAAAGVEWYWIVDPLARAIEAYHLEGDHFGPVAHFDDETLALPPFDTLVLQPPDIWR